ncbi:Uncharacterised protein [Legionella beliardensis]|uniref:Uncharacterized protein n=1 Tax=Legionella beliardensis TaxID=91822 RepID=A0A378I313_9GAMM|nr:hypothetical protein [Legionella beliardensis]STX29548.1 Uncharacterised protein [Legionella beliardensis]
MEFLDIAEKIIPAYASLPSAERHHFQSTSIGQDFVKLIKKIKRDTANFQSSVSLFNVLFSPLETRREQLINDIDNSISDFKETYQDHQDYKLIKEKCDFLLLQEDLPLLRFLNEDERRIVVNTEYSQTYIRLKVHLKQSLKIARSEFEKVPNWQNQDTIEKLNTQYLLASDVWHHSFQDDIKLTELRNLINSQQIVEDLIHLAKFFPLLNCRLNATSPQTEFEKLIAAINHSNQTPEEIYNLEKKQLSDLLYYCMQQITLHDLQFINLKQFNKEQAQQMAAASLQAFNEQSQLRLCELLQNYHQALNTYVLSQLKLINGKAWQQSEPLLPQSLLSSLSHLLNHSLVNQTNEFLRRLSDAHAFIQATGFATQNESSFLAILDFYNYNRFAGQVAETKSILASLLNPFLPLYFEYKNIALYEKSIFFKLYRTVMPALVAVAFIILVAALLSPLGLPELAFAAAFIPTLFIGVALATNYVLLKDKIYNGLREFYYDGPYNIPEFQINQRMLTAFKDLKTANEVKKYYIQELKTCIDLDKFYQSKKKQGILTTEEIAAHKENTAKLNLLYLEWYDIHSNNELSYTIAPEIILTRLKKEGCKEYQALEAALESELGELKSSIHQTVNDLEATFRAQELQATVSSTVQQAPALKIHYTPCLFKPSFVAHKEKAEEYDKLIIAIQPSA